MIPVSQVIACQKDVLRRRSQAYRIGQVACKTPLPSLELQAAPHRSLGAGPVSESAPKIVCLSQTYFWVLPRSLPPAMPQVWRQV